MYKSCIYDVKTKTNTVNHSLPGLFWPKIFRRFVFGLIIGKLVYFPTIGYCILAYLIIFFNHVVNLNSSTSKFHLDVTEDALCNIFEDLIKHNSLNSHRQRSLGNLFSRMHVMRHMQQSL